MGAVVFADTMFYAAIAPLLPGLAHALRLSKLSAGLMTASYPVGTFLGALPGGLLTVRVGPKRAVYLGLALLAGSTLAFGWLHDAAALDCARLVEGVGGACSWAGALAWVVAETPASRRGGAIGAALAAAVGGSLFGPVIGTVGSAVGRGPAFSAVVVFAVVLIDQARRLPLVHSSSSQGLRHLADALRRTGTMAIAAWLVVLPALGSGVLNVLAPLRLHRLGAGAGAIGGTFLAASAVEALLSPVVGRLSDRRGRLAPLRFGLLASALTLACFTLPATAWGLAALVVASAMALGTFWAPAMAMLSDAGEAGGLEHGLAAALMNMAWALGQMAGGGAGGALAKAAGDAVPMAGTAVLCVLTLGVTVVRFPDRPGARWWTRPRPRLGSRSGDG
jgi:MFS family permease